MKPEDFGITNYKWNNGKLDCFQDVDLYNKNLKKLPFEFGIVTGYFYCHNNNLTSLEHCPSSVGGHFVCDSNKLTTLEHCPSSVGGDFWCSNNNLTTLEHCPSSVGGDFYCHCNKVEFTDQDIKDKDIDNLIAIRSLFNK